MMTMSAGGVSDRVGPSVLVPRFQLLSTVSFTTSMRVRPKSPPAHIVPSLRPITSAVTSSSSMYPCVPSQACSHV